MGVFNLIIAASVVFVLGLFQAMLLDDRLGRDKKNPVHGTGFVRRGEELNQLWAALALFFSICTVM